jgi:hypothetical protein
MPRLGRFMGFAGVMSSDMLNGLFAEYGITPKVFNDGPEMRRWLDAQGLAYTSDIIEGQWVQKRGRDETIDSCSTMLLPYSVTPDRAFMERYIQKFEREPGVYVERTDYKIELLLWRKEGRAARDAGQSVNFSR